MVQSGHSSAKQAAGRCRRRRADGRPCQAQAQRGKRYCFFHDPAQRKTASAVRSAGGLARTWGPAPAPGVSEKPLRRVADVVELLEETIHQVRRGEMDIRTANAVGFLSMGLVNAIEKGILEQRLAQLEAVVAARPAMREFINESNGEFVFVGKEEEN